MNQLLISYVIIKKIRQKPKQKKKQNTADITKDLAKKNISICFDTYIII